MQLGRALLTLGLFRSIGVPPVELPRFAGITWEDRQVTVERKLVAAGYALAGTDAGDLAFRGKLAGYDGEGWVYFAADGKAAKVIFTVRPREERLLDTYDRMRRSLIRTYGDAKGVEIFTPPYARDDGRTLEAIREGKAIIATAWKLQARDDMGTLLQVRQELTIRASYEGPNWAAEIRRRSGR